MGSDAGRLGFSLEEIRAESAWLKRLAVALARGEDGAEDAVQEAWLASLGRPPQVRDGIRAWLRVVLANAVRKQRRGSARRRARETAVASVQIADPVADPSQLAERLEAQRLVAELALALDEPLRSTLLLCYYEDFSPSQIAARQGVPAGTVRWRLKQARDLLRVQLASRYAGQRSWRALLLPLLPGARRPGLGKGVLLMKVNVATKVGVLGLVALLALLLGLGWWGSPGLRAAHVDPRPGRIGLSPPDGTSRGSATSLARGPTPGQPTAPRVHVPRFATALAFPRDAGAVRLAVSGPRLAGDHGHLRNLFPDGGDPSTPHAQARIEDKLGRMHERADECLAAWHEIDPDLAAGIVLGIKMDQAGLEDVFIDGMPEIPDGPLRCLSSAVYEIDWSRLTNGHTMVTLPLRYEAADAGAVPAGDPR